MTNPSSPPVSASVAAHVERIRARNAERAAEQLERDPRPTAEVYAERALTAVRADEVLRRQAMLNDKRARGEWVPQDDDQDEGDVEETDEYEDDAVEDTEEETEAPVPTWERYAAIERERQTQSHQLVRAAKRGVAAHAGQRAQVIW